MRLQVSSRSCHGVFPSIKPKMRPDTIVWSCRSYIGTVTWGVVTDWSHFKEELFIVNAPFLSPTFHFLGSVFKVTVNLLCSRLVGFFALFYVESSHPSAECESDLFFTCFSRCHCWLEKMHLSQQQTPNTFARNVDATPKFAASTCPRNSSLFDLHALAT